MDNYNEVYVKGKENDKIEINPEYVYMMIPSEYICIYHKILVLLSDFGNTLFCNCCCKDTTIIDCWNMFQSAVACYNMNNKETATKFIDYIKDKLNKYYKGTDKEMYNGSNFYPITPDGKLKATVSCNNVPTFYVDTETGKLYTKYLEEQTENKVFTIEDNNLIVKSNQKV